MLIPTSTVVAIRCPACDRVEFHVLSLFSFAGGNSAKINCSCGAPVMQVSTREYRNFQVQVRCGMCETRHLWQFQRRDLWSTEVVNLQCDETDLEIGCIGPKEQVKQCIRNHQERSLSEMAEELGFSGYFENPGVSYEMLENLYNIADAGRLSCQCGNQNIEMEIFPNRVELRCGYCRSGGALGTEGEADLTMLRAAWEVQLTGEGLNYRETGAANHSRRSKK